MVQTKSGDVAGDLSMKFREISNDQVLIDATPDQKTELASFIRLSIDTDQVEISNHAGVTLEYVEGIYNQVLSQADNDDPLILSKYDFGQVAMMASAWDDYGFKPTNPERYCEFDVSKEIVDNIGEMSQACQACIG